MTKREKLAHARSVRAYLARFIDLQEQHVRELVAREWTQDPDYTAMNHLLRARHELQALIEDLTAEGYGRKP